MVSVSSSDWKRLRICSTVNVWYSMGGGSITCGLFPVVAVDARVAAAAVAGVFVAGVLSPAAGVTTGDGTLAAGVGPGVVDVAGVPNENPDLAAGVVVLAGVDDASLALSFSPVEDVVAAPKLNPPDDDAFESLDASVVAVAVAPPPKLNPPVGAGAAFESFDASVVAVVLVPPPKENEVAGLSASFALLSPPPKLNPEEPLLSLAAAGAALDPPNEKLVEVDVESFLSPLPPETLAAGAGEDEPNENPPAAIEYNSLIAIHYYLVTQYHKKK